MQACSSISLEIKISFYKFEIHFDFFGSCIGSYKNLYRDALFQKHLVSYENRFIANFSTS